MELTLKLKNGTTLSSFKKTIEIKELKSGHIKITYMEEKYKMTKKINSKEIAKLSIHIDN